MRKRKMTRVTAGAMAAVLSMAALWGCSSKEGGMDSASSPKTETTVSESRNGTESGAVKEMMDGSMVSKEPKEFTVFLNFNNMPFDSDWQVWQEVAKRTNVSLKGTISLSNSNEEEAFNLMLSSGQLADIIGYVDAAQMEKLGRDGGMISLNDLIKQYAPNIQKALDEDARFRQTAYSLDGNIYQIPKNQELIAAEFWWLRQDWMDKLNLKSPATVDELHDVLYAFRNQDPNGNGLKDEIPMFDRAGWKQPDEYLCLWDTSLEFYPRDSKMTYEPLEENFKTGVTNMVKWYQEGLIDPEIFTRGASARDTLLSGNLGGCTHDWVSASNYNSSLPETIPGFRMVAVAPPANQNGFVSERASRYPGSGWGISSQCKDPETAIKFMDYFFTQDGRDLMNWGIKEDTYTVEGDGKKQFTDKVMKSELTPIGYLRSIGAQYRIGMEQDGEYEYATMNEDGIAANELYNAHLEWFDDSLPPYLDGKMALKYTAEDEAEYKTIMADITPYVDEKFQSWILGVNNFDADYDGFIKELKVRGIDRALEINQKAYETFLSASSK